MNLTFDKLCDIILEGKKAKQFARLEVANDEPVFTMEDVLKDPNDPSKGVKTYFDQKIIGSQDEDGPERVARRALRRINWVSKSIIRKVNTRGLDLRRLHQNIMFTVEQYLRNVLRYSSEQIDEAQKRIAREAAFIGNLLLPPTRRTPNAKGVFIAEPEFVDKAGPSVKRPKKDTSDIAERISHDFNMTVDEFIAAFDPDLIDTIKQIIHDGPIVKAKPVQAESPTDELPGLSEPQIAQEAVEGDGFEGDLSGEVEDATEDTSEDSTGVDSPDEESRFEGNSTGASVEEILKDPRIKNVYDARIVRKIIKSMISIGTALATSDGKIKLTAPGEDTLRGRFGKWKDEKDIGDLEDIPGEQDVKQLAHSMGEVEPTEADLKNIESEDEEDRGDEVDKEDKLAATRLGYGKSEEEEEEEETSDDDNESWYK